MEADLELGYRNEHEADRVTQFVYRLLRLLCGLGTLITAVAKIPLIVAIVQFILDYMKFKAEQQAATRSIYQDPPLKIDLELKLSVLFVGILYILHIIVPLITCLIIAFNKRRCYWPYFTVTSIWVILVIIAVFVKQWKLPFGLSIIIIKHLMVGFWILEAPMHWEVVIVRVSVIIDIITLPLLIAYLVLQYKYGLASKECSLFTKRYSLIFKKDIDDENEKRKMDF